MLLSAILFPVFGRVRENARRSSCQSNLRQLGLGIIQYTQDYDERLPCGTVVAPSYYLGTGWATQLRPYIPNPQVYKCPSDTSKQTAPVFSVSYAYNNNLVRNSTNSNTFLLRPLASLVEPSRTVLLTEVRYGDFNPKLATDTDSPVSNGISLFGGGRGDGNTSLQMATGLFTNSPADDSNCNNRDTKGVAFPSAHFVGLNLNTGGANYLGIDGHVKWLRSSQVSAGAYSNSGTNPETALQAEGIQYNGVGKHVMTYSHF